MSYPLVGIELGGAVELQTHSPWQMSLHLLETPSPEHFTALSEGLDEVLFGNLPTTLELASVPRVGILNREDPKNIEVQAWQVSSTTLGDSGLEAKLETWTLGERTERVAVLKTNLEILKNIALVEQFRKTHPDIDRVVVETATNVDSDPELLVHQTVAFMGGVLGGAHLLRVSQVEGEPLNSVWSRLNILRLLRWEAQLGSFPSCTEGAGLFAELNKPS